LATFVAPYRNRFWCETGAVVASGMNCSPSFWVESVPSGDGHGTVPTTKL
jgi:hypothetical protein